MCSTTAERVRGAIGRRYATEPVSVDADAIRAYAAATKDGNPRYDGSRLAPPLFGVRLWRDAILAAALEGDLALDTLRLLHGEQRLSWHAPLSAGDEVRPEVELVGAAQKAKGCVVYWDATARVAGAPRVTATFSFFVRDQRLPGLEPGDSLGTTRPVPSPAALAPGATPVFSQSVAIDGDQALRYAAASRDDNPIHTDDATARAAGYPRPILHGLCTLAIALNAVVEGPLAGDPAALRELAVRFREPVLPGWTLTTAVYAEADGALRFDTVNQDGLAVLAGARVSAARAAPGTPRRSSPA